jgi:ribosomal protein S18 acetylase RimI-like enzyme
LPEFSIRPLGPGDRSWVDQAMRTEWGAQTVVVHQVLYRPSELSGFVAEQGVEKVGLLTYQIAGRECEIVTLNSWHDGRGIGTALIEAVQKICHVTDCSRLWLITTNDNTPALRFYQKRGFRIAAVHIGAVEDDRRLKPEIPASGLDGIPILDEIELEINYPV